MARTVFLGGFELPLIDISDDISHDINETKYPYQNGADFEDMGVNPEAFRFNCVIIDENFEKYFEIRKFFLSRFDEPIMLTHPELGILVGWPKNASFGEDLKKGFVSFNFEFIIDDLQPSKTAFIDVLGANEAEFKEIIDETIIDISEQLAAAGVPDIEGSDYSLLDKWASMGDAARNYASGVGASVAKMQGYIAQVKAPIDAISSTIEFIDSLSGNLTKSIVECCESFVSLARKIDLRADQSSSKAVIAALANDMLVASQNLNEAPQGVKDSFNSIAAATIALETARLINNDEMSLASSIAEERVQLDDDNGNALGDSSESYLMTPADLEDTLAISRTYIQRSLKASASSNRLKKMASNLVQSVLRVKMEYMTTKQVVVQEPTPLHHILNNNGLTYKSADRVCALNGTKNPTFMNGEVLIYES